MVVVRGLRKCNIFPARCRLTWKECRWILENVVRVLHLDRDHDKVHVGATTHVNDRGSSKGEITSPIGSTKKKVHSIVVN